MDFITKNYPDFNWEKYRDMNPYLYFMNLRTPEDYTLNFLNEGRFVGRRYKDEHINNYSIHVLLATIGNDSIFNILKCLKNELKEDDYLTVVFDASNKNIYNVSTYCKENIKSKVNIVYEEKNLGYWGHGIRNKHNKLEGDFIYHIDDDDHIVEGAFDKVRKILKDKDTIYIFAIQYRGVEQLVARWAHNPKVVSSSLAPATKKKNHLMKIKWFFCFKKVTYLTLPPINTPRII